MAGRASGGLVLLINQSHLSHIDTISITEISIIVHVQSKATGQQFIIGNFYIPPGPINDPKLEQMAEQLESITDKYAEIGIIMGGDFNARIGELGEIPTEMHVPLSQFRSSQDKIRNKRGMELTNIMEENEMIPLNGRVEGDLVGNFTYVTRNGKSTIDLIYGNTAICGLAHSLQVLQQTPVSYHAPVCLEWCDYQKVSQVAPFALKYSWKPLKATQYQEAFKQELEQLKVINKSVTYEPFLNCIEKAAISSGLAGEVKPLNHQDIKPWFDKSCREIKKDLKRQHLIAKATDWEQSNLSKYIALKQAYKKLCRLKRREHWSQLRSNLNKAHNQQQFWKALRPFRSSATPSNVIPEEKWKEFYDTFMPKRSFPTTKYADEGVPILDCKIDTEEVIEALKKVSSNKAPGPNGIPNEFLKSIPIEGIEALALCFSEILDKETPPESWGSSLTVMLHKKGSMLDPNNYRPIALLDTLLKLFTQILCKRLTQWANETGVLPEAQGGFRSKRSCDDQIFTLQSALQIGTRKKGSKVYALFLDFARAFPSIPHIKLWDKLHKIGVSGKFIRILSKIYSNASTKIRLDAAYSSPIEVTEGLLQGEVLSPLLFSLYISDIEQKLTDFKVDGIRINSKLDLQILLYADDMVILCPTSMGLKMKIKFLTKYFDEHGLKVHLDKTKVVVFRRGGRIEKELKFNYKGESIGISNQYTYLGVQFSSSTLFRKAALQFKDKGLRAVGATLKVLISSRLEKFKQRKNLFNALASSVVLYASHLWALNYMDEVEKVQNLFLRRMFGLTRGAPSYICRLEAGMSHLKLRVIQQAIKFRIRLLQMNEERYPKMCYDALHTFALTTGENSRYNWVKNLNDIIQPYMNMEVWSGSNLADIIHEQRLCLSNLAQKFFEEDIARVDCSPTYSDYQKFHPTISKQAAYLNMPLNIHQMRIIAQARVGMGSYRVNLAFIKIDEKKKCNICNLDSFNTLKHVLLHCSLHTDTRREFLKHPLKSLDDDEHYTALLNPGNKQEAKDIANFISCCMLTIQAIPIDYLFTNNPQLPFIRAR